MFKILKYPFHRDNFSSSNRSQNLSSMTDYYVTMTTGKRRLFPSGDIKTEEKRIFFNVLVVIYSEINKCFSKKDDINNILKAFRQTLTKLVFYMLK